MPNLRRERKMAQTDERRQKEEVLRALFRYLAAGGFTRTKPTWFVRVHSGAVEFIHVHKFTFGPYLRVHAGRRRLSDTSEPVALDGPDSDEIRDWRFLLAPKRKYDFSYSDDPESVTRCARQMTHFCAKVAEPWFQEQRRQSESDEGEPSAATVKLLRLDKIA